MKFIYANEKSFQDDMPFTYNWLKSKEPYLIQLGLGIEVYEADFDRLSIHLYPLTSNHEQCLNIDTQNDFYRTIQSQCCICGDQNDIVYIGRKGVPICNRCRILNAGRFDSIYQAFTYDFVKFNEDNSHNIPRQKIRLRALDGHIFYKYSNELIFIDNEFYIKDSNPLEKVNIAGIYTNARDITGKRIYTGDVLLAQDPSGRKFWGMCIYAKLGYTNPIPQNSQLNKYALFHGDCYPSPLIIAKKIYILGSVCDIASYKDYKNEIGCYGEFYDLHNLNNPPCFPFE